MRLRTSRRVSGYRRAVLLKALLLADIHSNLEALEAIFADCGAFDRIWCMGDVVGYGPDPVLTLELLRSHDFRCVSGNHDAAVSGVLSVDNFNEAAAWAARWTTSQLSPEDLQYLKSLPLSLEEGLFTLVHGSLRAPFWEYLVSVESAMASLALMRDHLLLGGALPSPVHMPRGVRGHPNLHRVPGAPAGTYGAGALGHQPRGRWATARWRPTFQLRAL